MIDHTSYEKWRKSGDVNDIGRGSVQSLKARNGRVAA